MNHKLDVNWTPPELLRKARNFKITRERSEHLIDWDNSSEDRDAVHQLCAIMVETVDLAKAIITINVEYEQEYDEDNRFVRGYYSRLSSYEASHLRK